MPLGKPVQGLSGNELLCNLSFERDAVGTLSGHGFHRPLVQSDVICLIALNFVLAARSISATCWISSSSLISLWEYEGKAI